MIFAPLLTLFFREKMQTDSFRTLNEPITWRATKIFGQIRKRWKLYLLADEAQKLSIFLKEKRIKRSFLHITQ